VIVIAAIISAIGSAVSVSDQSMFVRNKLADADDSSHFIAAGSLDATSNAQRGGGTSAASSPEAMAQLSSISSFSAKPRASFYIRNDSYSVDTAGKTYSLTNPDSQTLRFEIQPGDHAWFDGSTVDRSQIQSDKLIPAGIPFDIAYQFMLEPGAANTASWFVTGEMHNDDWAIGRDVKTSPPFAIELTGDRLQVVARYCPTGLDPSNGAGNLKMLTLWTAPNPIQRGQYNDIKISANVSNTSSGYLQVWVNGAEVVNYHGPLGYGAATYWEEGLYRSADAFQTVAANFRNLIVNTRSPLPSVQP
jgi:hypothetical protein